MQPGASGNGGWSEGQLTDSGRFVRASIRGEGSNNPSPTPGGGCCKFGADCGDCGEDGTGWCHDSASNCAQCTGTFDPSAAAPNCGSVPSPPSPSPPSPPSPPPSPPSPPSPTPGGSVVERHGALSVQGNKIV